jgi:tRNA(Ser,Leu) C12 N-acetylase TAN1
MSSREVDVEGFDLLVSTGRGLEARCISDLRSILGDGDSEFRASKTVFSGLIKAWVGGESRRAVGIIRDTLIEEPWHNDVIKRVVPIDTVVRNDPGSIVSAAEGLLERCNPDTGERFRVRIRKRGSDTDRMALIRELADLFDNPVDLEKPDFELRVEMVRSVAGVSLIRRGEIFPDL